MMSRAKRQFNVQEFSEGETTDQSTLTNVSRLSCPRILNTLQSHDNGTLLSRPYLVRTKQTYREQLMNARPITQYRHLIEAMDRNKRAPNGIMPRHSGYLNSIVPNTNSIKQNSTPAKPRRTNRRSNQGSGVTSGRPMTAEKYGLKSPGEGSGSSSSSSSASSPSKILREYENGLSQISK